MPALITWPTAKFLWKATGGGSSQARRKVKSEDENAIDYFPHPEGGSVHGTLSFRNI